MRGWLDGVSGMVISGEKGLQSLQSARKERPATTALSSPAHLPRVSAVLRDSQGRAAAPQT
jgi:hypothetical protein